MKAFSVNHNDAFQTSDADTTESAGNPFTATATANDCLSSTDLNDRMSGSTITLIREPVVMFDLYELLASPTFLTVLGY